MSLVFSRATYGDLIDAWFAQRATVRAILTNSSSYTDTSTLLDIIQQEVSEANGYSRKTVSYTAGSGSYDAAQTRFEKPIVSFTITASGASIQFDRVYIVGACKSYANQVVSNINATSNRLEFTTTPVFSVGDKVTVTADSGGTVPPELLSTGNPTTLFVQATGSNWITLAATSGGSVIDFGSGVNSIRVRAIDGVLGFWEPIGSTTILDGTSSTINLYLNAAGSGVDVE